MQIIWTTRLGKLQTITFLTPQRMSFVLRLRQSFPEDCARLKLSSARASQAGLKEMMTRRRVRGYDLVHYRPQRLFHPLIALRVHVVGDEVVVGLTADTFVILTIVPDRVVGTEVFKAGAAIGYSQEVSSSLFE